MPPKGCQHGHVAGTSSSALTECSFVEGRMCVTSKCIRLVHLFQLCLDSSVYSKVVFSLDHKEQVCQNTLFIGLAKIFAQTQSQLELFMPVVVIQNIQH